GAGRVYVHQDARDNVVAVTDEAGALVERIRYDDFGNAEYRDAAGAVVAGDLAGNPYGFQGRRFDEETGFFYFRARYLDPAQGRFVNRDPLGLWGDPSNLGNPYAFCSNDPVNRVDPSGLDDAPGLGINDLAPGLPGIDIGGHDDWLDQFMEGKTPIGGPYVVPGLPPRETSAEIAARMWWEHAMAREAAWAQRQADFELLIGFVPVLSTVYFGIKYREDLLITLNGGDLHYADASGRDFLISLTADATVVGGLAARGWGGTAIRFGRRFGRAVRNLRLPVRQPCNVTRTLGQGGTPLRIRMTQGGTRPLGPPPDGLPAEGGYVFDLRTGKFHLAYRGNLGPGSHARAGAALEAKGLARDDLVPVYISRYRGRVTVNISSRSSYRGAIPESSEGAVHAKVSEVWPDANFRVVYRGP
ncbi:RHS repeat-associated core domain-containing protein, partial [Planctomycetota bacterium]|nr:RHS repeat-associated core domain-containing protein [Planctomycetota bacterium]